MEDVRMAKHVVSEARLGGVLVALSAAVFALAGIFTKSIQADQLTVNSWRGLVGGLLILAYVLYRRRGDRGESLRLGWSGWMLAGIGAIASLLFIAAFKHTYVANVVVIYATAPLMIALLAWLMIGEAVGRQTTATAAACLLGVAIMVGPGVQDGHAGGDLLALLMTFAFSLYAVLVRRFRNAPVVWAGAVSAFLCVLPAWLLSAPLAVSRVDALLLAAFGITFALAVVLWTEGARRIPAAAAGLIGMTEVAFGIGFAWLLLAEVPPKDGLIGGAIVMTAVCLHAWRGWSSEPERPGASPKSPQKAAGTVEPS